MNRYYFHVIGASSSQVANWVELPSAKTAAAYAWAAARELALTHSATHSRKATVIVTNNKGLEIVRASETVVNDQMPIDSVPQGSKQS